MKYILVAGAKSSNMRRGVLSASIGVMLQSYGYNVTFLKIDPYLNFNAGKIEPSVHGEIYVLKDGAEVDLDLGNFERFCRMILMKENFLTNGKILYDLISESKKGKNKNGEEITFSKSYNDYVSDYIRKLSENQAWILNQGSKMQVTPDIMIIEIGGEAWKDEFKMCAKAVFAFMSKLDPSDRCTILMSYLPENQNLEENAIRNSNKAFDIAKSYNIAVDAVVFRLSDQSISKELASLSLECSIPEDSIFFHKVYNNLYEMPIHYYKSGLYHVIQRKLILSNNKLIFSLEKNFDIFLQKYPKKIKIGILTRYKKEGDPYISLIDSIMCAGNYLKCEIEPIMIDVSGIQEKGMQISTLLGDINGIIIPGGFGDRYIDCKIDVARHARLHNIPCLGICLGFQIMIIEFAKNVLGISDATSKEFTNEEKSFVITKISDLDKKFKDNQICGGEIEINLKGTMKSKIYKSDKALAIFRHSYCLNNSYLQQLEANGMRFLGVSENYKNVIFMIESHHFYVGVQHHPELSSRPEQVDPVIFSFIKSVRNKN